MNKITRVKIIYEPDSPSNKKWYYQAIIGGYVYAGLTINFDMACIELSRILGKDITQLGILIKEEADEQDN